MRKRIKYYILLILSSMFLVTCSPTTQYNVLSFFFDGVPDPNYVESDTVAVDNVLASVEQTKKRKEQPKKFIHEPYSEGDCFMCHDENNKSKLNQEQPDLCYNCHEDFNDKYKFVHGPVAGGFCTECHTAHIANYDNLLIRQGQDLCTYCHELRDVLRNENHEGLDGMSCTECHNPHGGEDRYIFN